MIKNFKEVISQIKNQVPIQELISEYLTVKRSGRGFVALCPFHDDHHPSMQIHPQKGIFKCFACGTGGDVITFYAQYNKKNWSEAVSDLAIKYGIKIEYGTESTTENKIKNELFELNKLAFEFFKANLFSKDSKLALEYLTIERQLTNDTIKKFGMGFAQNSWDSLFNYFSKEKHLPRELIIASGLFIVREDKDSYYDRFRNRIMFPIYNENNNILGFGGRILPSSDNADNPKYINSPETLIYNKGQILYGLNFAKDTIKKQDCAILTEGYLDVITAHQYELFNTVATLGTALTLSQLRLLTKHTTSKKVFLCMDTDIAGKKAVENIFRLIQDTKNLTHFDLQITSLPKKDLDESLRSYGTQNINKTFLESKKIIYFILDRFSTEYIQAVKSNNDLSKNLILDDIIHTLAILRDPIEQNDCIKYISTNLKIEEDLIRIKLKNYKKQSKHKISQESKNKEDVFKMHSNERFIHAELELLMLYICSFPLIHEIKEKLSNIIFIDEKHKLIKEYLDNLDSEGSTPQEIINKLVIEFNEYKHIMAVVSELALKIETDNVLQEQHYIKNKDKILAQASEWINWWITNKQKMTDLTAKLKICNNPEEELNILSQMMKLIKKKES